MLTTLKLYCRALILLWVLQRPVGPLSGDTGPQQPWIKRVAGFMYAQIQRNIDGGVTEGAAEPKVAGDDRLLWHLSFGANMNPEARGVAASCPCCTLASALHSM